MDDFLIFNDSKKELKKIKESVINYLQTIRLNLHKKKCQVFPVKDGIDFLGFRIFHEYRRIRKSNAVSYRRKLKKMAQAYSNCQLDTNDILMSVQSWNAHAAFGNTYSLRRNMFDSIEFNREGRKFKIIPDIASWNSEL